MREAIKTLIILLLIMSLLIMGAQLWIFGSLSVQSTDIQGVMGSFLQQIGIAGLWQDWTQGQHGLVIENYGSRFAFPSTVSLLQNGVVKTTGYDAANTRNAYRIIEDIFPELLAGTPSSLTEAEWQYMLKNENAILIDFGRAISISLCDELSGLTVDSSVKQGSVRFALILLDRKNGLAFREEKSGKYYTFPPLEDDGRLPGALERLSRDIIWWKGSMKARENTLEKHTVSESFWQKLNLLPEAVYPAEEMAYPAVFYSQNPIYSSPTGFDSWRMQSLLAAFRYNPSTIKRYPEDTGTQVFVENFSNIRITPEGSLHYKASQTTKGLPLEAYLDQTGEYYTVADVVRAAGNFLSQISQDILGGKGGELRLSEVYYDEETAALYLLYDYVIDGVKVQLESANGEQYAGKLRYQNGYFTAADLVLRTYNKTETENGFLPILKAAELLGLSGKEKEIVEFRYLDNLKEEKKSLLPSYYGLKKEGY